MEFIRAVQRRKETLRKENHFDLIGKNVPRVERKVRQVAEIEIRKRIVRFAFVILHLKVLRVLKFDISLRIVDQVVERKAVSPFFDRTGKKR